MRGRRRLRSSSPPLPSFSFAACVRLEESRRRHSKARILLLARLYTQATTPASKPTTQSKLTLPGGRARSSAAATPSTRRRRVAAFAAASSEADAARSRGVVALVEVFWDSLEGLVSPDDADAAAVALALDMRAARSRRRKNEKKEGTRERRRLVLKILKRMPFYFFFFF